VLERASATVELSDDRRVGLGLAASTWVDSGDVVRRIVDHLRTVAS